MKRLLIGVAAALVVAPTAQAQPSFSRLLEQSNRYTMRSWYPQFARQPLGSGEIEVRPPASFAVALAAGNRTRQRTRAVDKILAKVAVGYPAWGGAWQGPLWAADLGLATLLLRGELRRSTRVAVRRVVTAEANRVTASPVPYYRRGGAIVTPGDTKAEENAWSSKLLAVAAELLPRHHSRRAWVRKGRELVVSALARPQDTRGRYRRLLRGGSNINCDYTVTNHGVREHPDYAAAVLGDTGFHALLARLAHRPTTPAALLNHRGIYRRLTRSYRRDGTIRRDWDDPLVESRPPFVFAVVDLQARQLGYAHTGRWERVHLRRTFRMGPTWPGPYGDAWNRAILASAAALGVLWERSSGGQAIRLSSTPRGADRT
jgi:hypothetical protein